MFAVICSVYSGDIRFAQPNHIEIVPNGLEGIIPALERLKNGVSCVKLIAHPQEGV